MLVSCLPFRQLTVRSLERGVIPIDLAFVHFGRVTDEQTTTVLQTEQGEGQELCRWRWRSARRSDAHRCCHPCADRSGRRWVQQTGTRGHGQELGLEADQATARDDEVQTDDDPCHPGVMLVISPLRRPSCSSTEP